MFRLQKLAITSDSYILCIRLLFGYVRVIEIIFLLFTFMNDVNYN